MSLERAKDLKNLEDVKKQYQQLLDKLGFSDITISDLRESEPSADEIDVGKFVFAEISSTPTLYYKNTAGNRFKLTFTAV